MLILRSWLAQRDTLVLSLIALMPSLNCSVPSHYSDVSWQGHLQLWPWCHSHLRHGHLCCFDLFHCYRMQFGYQCLKGLQWNIYGVRYSSSLSQVITLLTSDHLGFGSCPSLSFLLSWWRSLSGMRVQPMIDRKDNKTLQTLKLNCCRMKEDSLIKENQDLKIH